MTELNLEQITEKFFQKESRVELLSSIETSQGLRVELVSGNKRLKLIYYEKEGIVESYIENNDSKREEGSTTSLYSITNKFLQELSNEQERQIRYFFVTQHPNMEIWAKENYLNVFGDPDEEYQDKLNRKVRVKKYIPHS
ncbi:MAG: hypothetical protein GW941_02895 [Candidatus Pacebacteria bacterium]|nr:hypothetical protein [Candidatus Paceibacterota bacterium]